MTSTTMYNVAVSARVNELLTVTIPDLEADLASMRSSVDQCDQADCVNTVAALERARVELTRLEARTLTPSSVSSTVCVGAEVVVRIGDDVGVYLVESGDMTGIDVLSPQSPIGAAILGAVAGVTVTVAVPSGFVDVEVLEIR